MKISIQKLLYFLLLVICGNIAGFAQETSDLVTENKVWSYIGIRQITGTVADCDPALRYHFDGVEQFDGLAYHAFRDGYDDVLAFMRQEESRVYIRAIRDADMVFPCTTNAPEDDSEDLLLYDFSLNPGDRFQTLACSEERPLIYFAVEGTVVGYYDLKISDKVLRVQRYNIEPEGYYPVQTVDVIEGIGPMRGLLCGPQINGFLPGTVHYYWYPYTVSLQTPSNSSSLDDTTSSAIQDSIEEATQLVVFNPVAHAPFSLSPAVSVTERPEFESEQLNLLDPVTMYPSKEMINPVKVWSYQLVRYNDSPKENIEYRQLNQYGFAGVTTFDGKIYCVFCNDAREPIAYMRQEGDRVYIRGFEKDGSVYLIPREGDVGVNSEEYLLYDFSLNNGAQFSTLVADTEDLNSLKVVNVTVTQVSTLLIDDQEYVLQTYLLSDSEGYGSGRITVVEGIGPEHGILCAPQVSKNTDTCVFPYRITNYKEDSVQIIKEENANEDATRIIDLHGRRIVKPLPGSVYIRDGRKYVAR